MFATSFGEGQGSHELAGPGDIVWALTDHLGTVRDLAQRDSTSGTTAVVNHRVYDSYGDLQAETNSAVDCLFGFTALPLDKAGGTWRTLTRPYDARIGLWLQSDWVRFNGHDTSLYRYCGNSPTNTTDPTGQWPEVGIPGFESRLGDAEIGSASAMAAATAAINGLAGFLKGRVDLCGDDCDKAACKAEVDKIVKAIYDLIVANYGKGTAPGSDPVGGYLCWDWAKNIGEALKKLGLKYWTVDVKMVVRHWLQAGYEDGEFHAADQPEREHWYVQLTPDCNSGTNGTVLIDDAYGGSSSWYHPKGWPFSLDNGPKIGKWKPWEGTGSPVDAFNASKLKWTLPRMRLP